MRAAWLDPWLEIRDSTVHGRGTFALGAIQADDDAPPGDIWLRVDGTRVWVPADDPSAPEAFLNHSCDPNVWMADEVTLVARRAIEPAEELTIDYALFEFDLRDRYGQHFHPEVLGRIARLKPG